MSSSATGLNALALALAALAVISGCGGSSPAAADDAAVSLAPGR
ncbi:MAG TPA: hypothetical protein VHT92_04380 [Candidatus Cybelea sp.]|jgi:hypothetical protein|nr:hypothetical protein [Candidatus Cybelea sp.]